ncbi:glycerol-3-phosphate O-acyltransferase 2 [[Candida] anglica]|uniref:Glycerol-3-phosphate O-acyltransferase 2 n=1 Tax=[Candida] anglica TaxID=148631 RepID=A0ABP0EGB7_9ASCO
MGEKNGNSEKGGKEFNKVAATPPPLNTDNVFLNWLHYIAYDFVLYFFSLIIHTFFRDIESRGSFNIPKKGPVVFVIAPHANQFIDPLVVMSKVKENSGRRIAFLIAAKSFRRKFIGAAAKLTGAIPVERAQDNLKSATGKIFVDLDSDNDDQGARITGEGTLFTQECMVKGLIGLPNSLGNVQVDRIESDTVLYSRKPFKINRESPTEKDKKVIELLTEGTSYKTAPHIDNNVLFHNVFNHLNGGKILGIFPEGGSHDRPDLLPLKAGVAIMALGAATSKDNSEPINVIPVGMNYFHPHKFRSRAVVEFGRPIVVDKDTWGPKYEKDSKATVNELLQTITLGLSEVTVTCTDYDTLKTLQAARRLYTSTNRNNIPLPMVLEMNRRLIKGYQKYADHPDVIKVKQDVSQYNTQLKRMGLHDHQVEDLHQSNRTRALVMFAERLFKVCLFCGLSLPGVFLFSPVFIVSKRISKKKAADALAGSVVKIRAKDVLATWKILVAMVWAPCLYILYSVLGTVFIVKSDLLHGKVPTIVIFLVCYGWSVLTTYASLRIGEIGVDYYKSLKPLFYAFLSSNSDIMQLKELRDRRRVLANEVTEFCEKYGPGIFKDYDQFYRDYNEIKEDDYTSDSEESEDPKTNQGVLNGGLSNFNLNDLADIPIFSNHGDGEDESESESDKEDEQERNLKESSQVVDESQIRRRRVSKK